jgi:hypothetical protein
VGKTVTISAGTLIGADAGNYTFVLGAATDLADITPAALMVTIGGSFTVFNKVYDGTNTATIDSNLLNLIGIQGADDVDLEAVATFLDKNAGTAKTVTLADSYLSGVDMGNYTLDFTGAPTATADITKKTMTIAGSFAASDKIEDGTTAAVIDATNLTVVGKVGGDTVDLNAIGVFADAVVGSAKIVYLTGTTIGGLDAANYDLDFTGAPTAFASILSSGPTMPPGGPGSIIGEMYSDNGSVGGSDNNSWWNYGVLVDEDGSYIMASVSEDAEYAVKGFMPCTQSASAEETEEGKKKISLTCSAW